ncbi:hypothetical protein ACVLV4_003034 [Rathayibacter agropyri]
MIVAIVAITLILNDDPTAGTVPPVGADRATATDIFTALDASDNEALRRVTPATSDDLRQEVVRSCGDIGPDGRSIDIHNDLVPTPVGVEVSGTSRRGNSREVCTLNLQWLPDQGWQVSARTGGLNDPS